MSDDYKVQAAVEVLRRAKDLPAETVAAAHAFLTERANAASSKPQDDVFADPETAPSVESRMRAKPTPAPQQAPQSEPEVDLQIANFLDKHVPYTVRNLPSEGKAVIEGIQRGMFMNLPRMIDMVGSDVVDVANALGEGKSLGDIWYGRNGFRRSFVDRNPDQFQQAAEEHPVISGATQIAASPFVAGRAFNALEKVAGVGAAGVTPLASAARGAVANAAGGALSRNIDQAVQPELRAMSDEDKLKDFALSTAGSGVLGGMANYGQTIAGRLPNLGARGKFRQESPSGRLLAEAEAMDIAEVSPVSTLLTNKPTAGKALSEAMREVNEAVAKNGGVTNSDPVEYFLNKSTSAARDLVKKLRADLTAVESTAAPRLELGLSKLSSAREALKANTNNLVKQAKAEELAKAEMAAARLEASAAARDVDGAKAVIAELQAAFPEELPNSFAQYIDDAYRSAEDEAINAARILLPQGEAMHQSITRGSKQAREAFIAGNASGTDDALTSMTRAAGIEDKTDFARRAVVGEVERVQGAADDVSAMRQVRVEDMRSAIAKEIVGLKLQERPLPGTKVLVKSLEDLDEMLAETPEGVLGVADALRITKHLSHLGKEPQGVFNISTQPYDRLAAAARETTGAQVPMLSTLQNLSKMSLQALENAVTFGLGLPAKTSRFDTEDFSQLSGAARAVKQYGKDKLITEALDTLADAKGADATAAREALARYTARRLEGEVLEGAGFKRPPPGIDEALNTDALGEKLRASFLKPTSMERNVAMRVAGKLGANPSRYAEIAPKATTPTGSLENVHGLRDKIAKYGKDPLAAEELDALAGSVPGLRKALDEASSLRAQAASTKAAGKASADDAANLASMRIGAQKADLKKEAEGLRNLGVGGDLKQGMRGAVMEKGANADAALSALRKAGIPEQSIQKYGQDIVEAFEVGGTDAVLEKIAISDSPLFESIKAKLQQALRNGQTIENSSSKLFDIIRSRPEIYEPLKMARALEVFSSVDRRTSVAGGLTFTPNSYVARISPHMEYRMEALRKAVGESDTANLVTVVRQLYDIYKRNQESQ